MQVQPLGQKDPLKEEMATCSSILSWKIPWTEEPGRLQPMGLQKVRHNKAEYSFFSRVNKYKDGTMEMVWKFQSEDLSLSMFIDTLNSS